MNERQRDRFLWLWSRRRVPGMFAVARRGALIGAAAGVGFTLMLAGELDAGQARGMAAVVPTLSRVAHLLVLSAGAFGLLGLLMSAMVYSRHEKIYWALLAAGAEVPTREPQLRREDRGPQRAVAIAAALIAVAIGGLFVAYG